MTISTATSQTAGQPSGEPRLVVCPEGQELAVEALDAALTQLGLTRQRPVLILVGGAANLAPEVARRLLPLFTELSPHLDRLGVAVIDGGTDCGVMALMGEARQRAAGRFPLIGIAPQGCVKAPLGEWSRLTDPLPPNPSPARGEGRRGWSPQPRNEAPLVQDRVPLDPQHSHFLLVPGQRWGDESPWLTAVAAHLAGPLGTLMLVAGGGSVTRLDVEQRLHASGPVLVLAGSGGTADQLAAGHYRSDGLEGSAGAGQIDDLTNVTVRPGKVDGLDFASGPGPNEDQDLAAGAHRVLTVQTPLSPTLARQGGGSQRESPACVTEAPLEREGPEQIPRIEVMALAEALDRLPQALERALAS